MPTSPNSIQQLSLPLISGVLDGPVKTSVVPIPTVQGSLAPAVDSSITLWSLLQQFSQCGWSWKMYPVSSVPSKVKPLRQLSTRWKRSGIWGDGSRVTLPMRVCLSTEIASSLSPVLSRTVPITSLLTAANCLGILRRENRARRKLDPVFVKSLSETLRLWYNVAVASGTPWPKASAPRYVPKLEDIKVAIQTDQYSVARNLTWTEWERLMGFPPGWTVAEGDSLVTQSPPDWPNGSAKKS